MRIFVFRTALTVLFSGLGLVSCGSDKSKDAAAQDRFRVTAPQILAEKAIVPVLGSGSLTETFSSEHKLRFPSLDGVDFNSDPITMRVHSDCRGRVLASREEMRFQNVTELALRDLMPAESLLQATGTNEPTICQFRFEVKNRHGSQHGFTIPNLAIQVPTSPLGLELHTKEPAVAQVLAAPLIHLEEAAFPTLRLDGHRYATSEDPTYLMCEGFHTRLPSREIDLEGLRSLARAQPLAYLNRPLLNASLDPQQVCRLVSETTGDQNRSLHASAQFTLQFAPPRLEVTVHPEFNGYTGPEVLDVPIFTVQIRNPHTVPVPVAISKGRTNSLAMRAALQTSQQKNFLGPTQFAALTLTLEGANAIPDSALLKFIIAPGATAVVPARTHTHYVCRFQQGRRDLAEFDRGFLGFYYQLDANEFALLQTPDNRLEEDQSFKVGSREVFLPAPTPAAVARPLPYWAPWTRSLRYGYELVKNVTEPIDLQTSSDLATCQLQRF
ncbi:MAG: hypothetical protein NDI61_04220 [Bdellovibrionaceae bacterium]|nr:hypothetical protein [Pseudobdellovibrionaceae bacterium]